MQIFYIGWLNCQNIGDQVLYQCFLQDIDKYISHKDRIIAFNGMIGRPTVNEIDKQHPLDFVVLGGGSLLQASLYLNQVEQALQRKIPVFSYGTGVDYLSQKYINAYLQNQKIDSDIFFHSCEVPPEKIIALMEQVNNLGVRGPLTDHFLKNFGLKNPNLQIIGDPALTFAPPTDDYIMNKYLTHIPQKTKVIAINWGTFKNIIYGYDEKGLLLQLIEASRYLIQRGYHLVIYPMYINDIQPCQEFYSLFENTTKVTLIPELCSATQIYHFLRKTFFTINLRLHSNVLSAAAEIPFISLAYHSKCIDFALSVDFLENTIYTDTTELVNFIKQKEEALATNYNHYIQLLSTQKNKYQKLKEKYIIKSLAIKS